jgi:hypothetical protein
MGREHHKAVQGATPWGRGDPEALGAMAGLQNPFEYITWRQRKGLIKQLLKLLPRGIAEGKFVDHHGLPLTMAKFLLSTQLSDLRLGGTLLRLVILMST